MKKIIFTFLLVLVFALPVHAAEMVTIENVSKDDVYNFLLQSGMRAGCTIQENTEHSLLLRSNRTDIKYVLAWGSNAYTQHAFNIVQVANNVLLSYEIRVVDGNQLHPFSKEAIPYYFPVNKEYAERGLQDTLLYLSEVKMKFNGIYFYGFVDSRKKKKNYIEILDVVAGSPSEKSGLKAGDRVVKINSRSIKDMGYFEFSMIISNGNINGQPIIIDVERAGKILTLDISPQFTSSEKYKN